MIDKDIKYFHLVKEIHKYWNIKRMIKNFPGALIMSLWLSPYLSAWAIKKNIKPDSLTRLMIPTAIIGSVLFVIPTLWIKIIGAMLVHLFFVFDLSDGQVARSTKMFSAYGEQLDHLAHHCSHFFLIIAMSVNLFQLNRYGIKLILALAGLMLFVEYLYRDICSINTEIDLVDRIKGNSRSHIKKEKQQWYSKALQLIKYLLFWFRCADNYILFASICIFIDICVGTNIVLILSYIYICSSLLKNIYDTIMALRYTSNER